jgi:tyrosyl-tRNA synthetase
MLSFDSVKLRLDREQSLSFLEFNYMILQGYDFLELFRRVGCRLQLGGSDQWGNIVNGIELSRRVAGAEVFGVTTPLLTTADGRKMGKTESGAVWLNADGPDGYRLSPYDYWQFWRNTADADVGTFLRRFTDVPLEEIARLEALEGAEINDAKALLATEATALLHGREAAEAAAETARQTFAGGGAGAKLPTLELARGRYNLYEVLGWLGFATSRGEARRLIKQGGVKIDGEVVTNEQYQIEVDSYDAKVSVGKKKHGIVRMVWA